VYCVALLNADATHVSACPKRDVPQGFVGSDVERFAGANIVWLLSENTPVGPQPPSHYEIETAFALARQMNVKVVRTFAVSLGCDQCFWHDGQIDEAKLESLDYAIKVAKDNDMTLFVSLMDNWDYYHGGKMTLVHGAGLTNPDAFFDDVRVKNLYKQYVAAILTHVNPYTGLPYTHESAIFAWETINEGRRSIPFLWDNQWTDEMASYIRSIDPHHMIFDGRSADAKNLISLTQQLESCAADGVSGHYYPRNSDALKLDSEAAAKRNKLFVVGEYPALDPQRTEFWWVQLLFTSSNLSDFWKTVEQSPARGDFVWSMFGMEQPSKNMRHGDGYSIYADNPIVDLLAKHGQKMSGGSATVSPVPK
jgi:hypothetical protein